MFAVVEKNPPATSLVLQGWCCQGISKPVHCGLLCIAVAVLCALLFYFFMHSVAFCSSSSSLQSKHVYVFGLTASLQALVPLMAQPDTQIHEEACNTIKQLLLEDVQGNTSLEAVQLVADLIRKRKCNVAPLVVSSLLVLRFEQVTPTAQGGEGVGGKVRS